MRRLSAALAMALVCGACNGASSSAPDGRAGVSSGVGTETMIVATENTIADTSAAPDASPAPRAEKGEERSDPDTVAAGALGAPVLGYGPGEDDVLRLIDRDGERVIWSEQVDMAVPDARGGIVLEPASQAAVVWLPTGEQASRVRLAEGDGEVILRGLLPDGRVLYSVRPRGETLSEGDVEEFFAVTLAEDAQPERVGSSGAYESWRVGPVVTAGAGLIHASCHLHCSLWPGLAETPGSGEPLYDGLTIDGLAATPDGHVVGFVHFDIVQPERDDPPELVLLDGTSFAELQRIPLPLDPRRSPGAPTVSMSADGQRILVSVGAAADRLNVPTTPYLVDGALTGNPRLRRVDFEGVLRWSDPVAASGSGGRVTAEEKEIAERLMAFAAAPRGDTFAALPLAGEVLLGLGPELTAGGPRPAGRLADPAAWRLDPDAGHFRGYAGPFSAIDILADAADVVVSGGPHSHCASPPKPAPDEAVSLRRISIQPADVESCIQWFTVDLFLTDSGMIAAITLDLWEP